MFYRNSETRNDDSRRPDAVDTDRPTEVDRTGRHFVAAAGSDGQHLDNVEHEVADGEVAESDAENVDSAITTTTNRKSRPDAIKDLLYSRQDTSHTTAVDSNYSQLTDDTANPEISVSEIRSQEERSWALVKHGNVDVGQQEMTGLSALVIAINNKWWDVVQVLLSSPQNLNVLEISHLEAIRDEQGGSVLHVAARENQGRFARALLEIKLVDVDALDRNGECAIAVAISHESWDAARVILNHVRGNIDGSGLEALKRRGETVLHLAARINETSTVEDMLRQRRANIEILSALNNEGHSPLVLAINNKSWDVVNYLIHSHKDVMKVSHLEAVVDECGGTVLHVAARENKGELTNRVLFLARHIIDVGYLDNEGNSALAVAIRCKSWHVVDSLLVERGFHMFFELSERVICSVVNGDTEPEYSSPWDVVRIDRRYIVEVSQLETIVDELGGTALHVAARENHWSLAEALLEQGIVDVDALDYHGHGAIDVATNCQSWSVAKLILNSRPDAIQVRQVNAESRSAMLFAAVGYNDVKLAELSINQGTVDAVTVNTDGRSVLASALRNKSWDVVRLLMNSCPDAVQTIHLDADVDQSGRTVLHHLNNKTPDDIVDRLIELGADFTQTDFMGNTTIHLRNRLIQRLDGFSSGKDVIRRLMNVQNVYGFTPLRNAFNGDSTDEVKILLKHGADVNVRDFQLSTPLHNMKVTEKNVFEISRLIKNASQCRDVNGRMQPIFWASGLTADSGIKIDTNYRDFHDNTALHTLAEVYDDEACDDNGRRLKTPTYIKDLLLEGADSQFIAERNAYGQTALHVINWKHFPLDELTADELSKLLGYFSLTDGIYRNCWHSVFLGECEEISVFTHLSSELSATTPLEGLRVADVFGRTPLHYAAMKIKKCKTCQYEGCCLYSKCCLELFGVDGLRVTDKCGRTPLHYAYWNDHVLTGEIRRSLPPEFVGILKEQLTQNDNDGFNPREIRRNRPDLWTPWRRRRDDVDFVKALRELSKYWFHLSRLSKNDSMAWCAENIFSCHGSTVKLLPIVDRHNSRINLPMSINVGTAVNSFMERLVTAVGEQDQRLNGRLLAVGSVFEQTRVDDLGEFDFNVVLVNVSDMCEIIPTEALSHCPPGFLQLKRKLTVVNVLPEYQEFFNKDGTLSTVKLNFAFQHALVKVLSRRKLWETEPMLDIDSHHSNYYGGHRYTRQRKWHILRPTKLCERINLRFNRPVCGQFIQNDISIDIVPVIHISGWWPEGGREVDEDIKSDGCNFVFDQPYQVPFSSTQYVKISFARAESLLIQKYSVRHAAYIIAKNALVIGTTDFLTNYHTIEVDAIANNASSFVMKTAALWSDVVTTETNFGEADLLKQVEMLFAKLYEFAEQDFVPCYFLPAHQFPVFQFETFLKHSQTFFRRNRMNYEELFPPQRD